jgi:hypothetical protein
MTLVVMGSGRFAGWNGGQVTGMVSWHNQLEAAQVSRSVAVEQERWPKSLAPCVDVRDAPVRISRLLSGRTPDKTCSGII